MVLFYEIRRVNVSGNPWRSQVLDLDRNHEAKGLKDSPKTVHLVVLVEEDLVINILLIYTTIISSWILRMKNGFLLGTKQNREIFARHVYLACQ